MQDFFSYFFTRIFAIRQEKNHFDFVEIFSHFDNIDIKDYRERLKKYWSGVLDTIARDTLTH